LLDEPEKQTDLPGVIPVFPLAGTILLPGSNLPLNIFEPRYLRMVEDARNSHGLIGMVQPQDPDNTSKTPDLFTVGGVGRITHFVETEDGRNLIRLTGLCRFAIADELPATTPYRQVQASWQPFEGDLAQVTIKKEFNREPLMAALKQYLEKKGLDADYDGINVAPDDVLVNTLSMIMPFGAAEKQALLEADGLLDRAKTLESLLTMAASTTTVPQETRPS